MRFLIIVSFLMLTACATTPNYQVLGLGERLPRQDVAVLLPNSIVTVDGTVVTANRLGYLVLKPGLHEARYRMSSGNATTQSTLYFKAEPGHTYRLRSSFKLLAFMDEKIEIVDVSGEPALHVTNIDAAYAIPVTAVPPQP